MTQFRRLLLLLVMIALPMQGVMASSRLCMPTPVPGTMDHADPARHEAHHAAPTVDHGAHDHGNAAAHDPGSGAVGSAPAADHAGGTCKHCAACTLTIALAPSPPALALTSADFAGYQPIVVPVPHNIADGLERPPRTI